MLFVLPPYNLLTTQLGRGFARCTKTIISRPTLNHHFPREFKITTDSTFSSGKNNFCANDSVKAFVVLQGRAVHEKLLQTP